MASVTRNTKRFNTVACSGAYQPGTGVSARGGQHSQQLHGAGQREPVHRLRNGRRWRRPGRGKELGQHRLHQARTIEHLRVKCNLTTFDQVKMCTAIVNWTASVFDKSQLSVAVAFVVVTWVADTDECLAIRVRICRTSWTTGGEGRNTSRM